MQPGRGRKLLTVGVCGLFMLSWPPAEWVFSRLLEFGYPVRPFHVPAGTEAIIVMGGGAAPPIYERPYALPDRDTVNHCAAAAWIHRQAAATPMLACEGSHGKKVFPSVMRELLMSAGVPEDLIWIEDRSRNTHENAMYGTAILRAHGVRQVVLITDAQSMPRAAACFRRFGVRVIPAATDFDELGFSLENVLPNSHAIRRNERTLHELLGLGLYRFRGWI